MKKSVKCLRNSKSWEQSKKTAGVWFDEGSQSDCWTNYLGDAIDFSRYFCMLAQFLQAATNTARGLEVPTREIVILLSKSLTLYRIAPLTEQAKHYASC